MLPCFTRLSSLENKDAKNDQIKTPIKQYNYSPGAAEPDN